MNLDDQIHRYFGTSELAAVPPEALAAGVEHMKVDLGLTKDRGERFALFLEEDGIGERENEGGEREAA